MTRRKSRSIDWLHVLGVAFVILSYALAITLILKGTVT